MINARSSGSLHRQVRRMLILCIAVVVLLSTSVGLGIGLYQEVRTRDQLLSNAAQMAADAPLLTDDIQADGVQQYLARTVQHVSEVDMLGVYDMEGKPTAILRPCLRCGRRIRAAGLAGRYRQPTVQRGKNGVHERRDAERCRPLCVCRRAR